MMLRAFFGAVIVVISLDGTVVGSDWTMEKIKRVWKEEATQKQPFFAEGTGEFELNNGGSVTKQDYGLKISVFPTSMSTENTGAAFPKEAWGFNKFYSYRVTKSRENWILREIGLKGKPEYDKLIKEASLTTKTRLLPSVFDLDRLADVADFFEFHRETNDLVICKINREFSNVIGALKSTYVDGEVHLLKENPGVVKQFTANALTNEKKVKLTRAFEHELHDGQYRIISRIYTDEYPEFSGGYKMTFRDQFQYIDSAPDEKVNRLSHFGLPEPNGIDWNDSDNRLWWLLGVALTLVAGLFLYLSRASRRSDLALTK